MTTLKSRGQIYHSRQKAYWAKVSDKMRKRAKRAWPKRHAEMASAPMDADTLRWRALQDRKGQLVKTPSYEIRHSTRRTDSYDVIQGGKIVCSGGRVVVGRYLGTILP